MIRKIQSIHLYWFHACINNLTLMFSSKHDKALFKFIIWVWDWTFGSKWPKPICCSCISQNTFILPCLSMHHNCCLALIVFFLVCRWLSPLDRRGSDDEFDDTNEEQYYLQKCQSSKTPCSFQYNPTLLLLLSFTALGQQRFICYLLR